MEFKPRHLSRFFLCLCHLKFVLLLKNYLRFFSKSCFGVIIYNPKSSKMKSLKINIFFKIGMIFLLILILLVPTALVTGLIDEREYRQIEAINEVSDKWSGR